MNDKLREIVIGLCKEHGCRLIYLAKAGSHRYGTSTPHSDIDVDGIFIPPKEELLLGEKIDHLKYTTKEDKFKNSSDDIDVKIYSIQYFLRNLLKKSDTNAIDILYSHTNESTILHSVEHVGRIFNNKDKLIEISNIMKFSYTAFSISQAKKFGIKSKSHSLRGIYQMEELYHNGYIKFPLKQCDILRDIKVGKYSFDDVDTLISDGLDRLGNLELEGSAFKGKRDESFIDNLILEFYK